MYKKYFGFQKEPFSITPDTELFYCSKIHEEILEVIEYQLNKRRGFIILTGDTGTGKTLICRTLLNSLHNCEFALILNPFLNATEILYYICKDFGLLNDNEQPNTGELFHILTDFLITTFNKGKNAVIIVDESQNLSLEAFEMIRQISNIELENNKLVQIIFVGQLELLEKINSDRLKQLRQRISTILKLEPLNFEETQNYINFRVQETLKYKKFLFDRAALKTLYKYSKGYPRILNQIAEISLITAYNRNKNRVSKKDVEAASKEYFLSSYKEKKTKKPFILTTLLALILLFAGIYYFYGINTHNSKKDFLLHFKTNNVTVANITDNLSVKKAVTDNKTHLKFPKYLDNKTIAINKDNLSLKNISFDNKTDTKRLLSTLKREKPINKIKINKKIFYNVFIAPTEDKKVYINRIKKLKLAKINYFSRNISGKYYIYIAYLSKFENAETLRKKLVSLGIHNIKIKTVIK